MPSIRSRRCECSCCYDVMEFSDGTSISLDNKSSDDEFDGCPACGSREFTLRIPSPRGGEAEKRIYPYFDRNLGVTCTSSAHRASIMKERGLHDADAGETRKSAERIAFERSADEGAKITARAKEEPWYREMADKTGLKRKNIEEYMRERRSAR